jgi:uncharacterized protein YacL
MCLTNGLNCGMIFVCSGIDFQSPLAQWRLTSQDVAPSFLSSIGEVRFIGISFLRIGFVLLAAFLGYHLGAPQIANVEFPWLGMTIGITLAAGIIAIERGAQKIPPKILLGGLLGLIVSLLLGHLLTISLLTIPLIGDPDNITLHGLVHAGLAYIGMVLGARKGAEFDLNEYKKLFRGEAKEENPKLLDTSVIIDGRVADICETGFLEGTLIIPQFVLRELQQIADSSDPIKRNRGRRGLDILQRIQRSADVHVKILEQDFPKIRDVDSKLVVLGKELGAKILTNDFNLNKVAELQGVPVLNVNQLANAVRPVVLPGELMSVHILKEGKEYGQGVAYLDDGTMVVVDSARKYVGKNVDVAVTSVLQTTAGRMIFTRLKDDFEREESLESKVGR